jgi:hypothetical protein
MKITRRLKILLALAVGVVVFIIATRPASHTAQIPEVVAAAPRATTVVPATKAKPAPKAEPVAAGTTAHASRRVADSSAAPSLFHPVSWYVPPPPPPPPPPSKPTPPPPPTAPPLPFTAMGTYAHTGGVKTYFLMRGDRVFDVHIGDTIDNTYSVDSEHDGVLTLTFLPLKIQQGLTLAGAP